MEASWTKLMEELKKEESMIAGYYAGVIVKAGNPTDSPFKLDLIFPKGLEVMYDFASKDDKNKNRLLIFLEEVLGRTIELNITQDSNLSNSFSKNLNNSQKLGVQIFEEDLKEDHTFGLINSIFDLKYEFSKQLPKDYSSHNSSPIIDLETDPENNLD